MTRPRLADGGGRPGFALKDACAAWTPQVDDGWPAAVAQGASIASTDFKAPLEDGVLSFERRKSA